MKYLIIVALLFAVFAIKVSAEERTIILSLPPCCQ